MFMVNLLENSSGVTNARIVCKDGIISSHKILVASTSEFIKNIMRDIPCNDDITLILPDFSQSEFKQMIYLVLQIAKSTGFMDSTATKKFNFPSQTKIVSLLQKFQMKNQK